MKKNLISVIILALVLANFVLTALLVFTVLPETKKANKLIEEVCSAHYLVAAISLSLNKESDVYNDKNFDISTKENLIKADINSIIGQHTMEEYNTDKESIYDEILSSLQDMLGADYVVGVNFTSSLTQ